MMTSAQVVETSVTTTDNSSSQDYTHLEEQTTRSNATPGFKLDAIRSSTPQTIQLVLKTELKT